MAASFKEKCLEPTERRRIAQDLLFTRSIALPPGTHKSAPDQKQSRNRYWDQSEQVKIAMGGRGKEGRSGLRLQQVCIWGLPSQPQASRRLLWRVTVVLGHCRSYLLLYIKPSPHLVAEDTQHWPRPVSVLSCFLVRTGWADLCGKEVGGLGWPHSHAL